MYRNIGNIGEYKNRVMQCFLSFPADHQNFFGMDERLGPVAISFRREEKEGSSGAQYTYRIIFRTTEVKELILHTFHVYIFLLRSLYGKHISFAQ